MFTLVPSAKKFIADNIDFIDNEQWKKFFEELLDSDLNVGEAKNVLDGLHKAQIVYDDNMREEVVVSLLDDSFYQIRDYGGASKTTVQLLYEESTYNLCGYSIREFQNLLKKYKVKLNIVVSEKTADPFDTVVYIL